MNDRRNLTNRFLSRCIPQFLLKGHARGIRAGRNIFVSLLSKAIGMVVTFLMVPLSIKYLGVEQYGVWVVISGIISWAGMFDFGFSHGLRNRLAYAVATNQHQLSKVFVSTTYFLLMLIALLIAGMGLFVIPHCNWSVLLKINNWQLQAVNTVAYIVLLAFVFQFVLTPINSILQAYHIPSAIQLIGVVGSCLSFGSVWLLYYLSKQTFSLYVAVVSFTPSFVVVLVSLYLYMTLFEEIRPNVKYIELKHIKTIGGLGLNFFIIQLCCIIIYSTDTIIISYLFGPTAVTVYAIPYKYYSLITVFFVMVMTPYWSAITEAYAKNEMDWIKSSITSIFKIIGLGALIAFFMFLSSNDVFRFWVGEDVTVPTSLTGLMGVYAIVMGVQTLLSYFSNGIGKLRMQIIIYITMAFCNLPLSYVLGVTFDMHVSGVLLATIICTSLVCLVLAIQYYKVVGGTAKGLWLK